MAVHTNTIVQLCLQLICGVRGAMCNDTKTAAGANSCDIISGTHCCSTGGALKH